MFLCITFLADSVVWQRYSPICNFRLSTDGNYNTVVYGTMQIHVIMCNSQIQCPNQVNFISFFRGYLLNYIIKEDAKITKCPFKCVWVVFHYISKIFLVEVLFIIKNKMLNLWNLILAKMSTIANLQKTCKVPAQLKA